MANKQTKIEISGNLLINYEIHGNGSHVVLLLPGTFGTIGNDLYTILDEETGFDRDLFTLVAWDPPGYGGSRPPKRDFTDYYRRDAHYVVEMMTKLGYEKYSVLGFCAGGTTALILAGTYPEKVEKLVVWGCRPYVTDGEREKIRIFMSDFGIFKPDKTMKPAQAAVACVYTQDEMRELGAQFVDAFNKLSDICCGDLPKIRCPTFVLSGEDDPLLEKTHPQYLAQNIKNSKLYQFRGGKHFIHRQFIGEFNEMVQQFLLH